MKNNFLAKIYSIILGFLAGLLAYVISVVFEVLVFGSVNLKNTLLSVVYIPWALFFSAFLEESSKIVMAELSFKKLQNLNKTLITAMTGLSFGFFEAYLAKLSMGQESRFIELIVLHFSFILLGYLTVKAVINNFQTKYKLISWIIVSTSIHFFYNLASLKAAF